MPIKIGNISAKDIYIGSTPAKEIRLGSMLIWSRAQEEVYYTLTLDGIDSPGINSCEVKINGEYQPENTVYQILEGSFVEVYINAHPGYSYFISSNIGGEADIGNGWYMNEDVYITVTASMSSYTLTVNFEGDKEAFSDGYKIFVDDMLIEAYRPDASISFEHSFSIAAGSTIWGEMTAMEDYTYSETITPTPANPWIMDKDYSITVVAEKKNYTLTVAYDEGVDHVDIYYKQPNEETFTKRDKTSQVNLLAGSQYYIIPSYKSGYVLDVPVELGDPENPLILMSDARITLYTAISDTPSEQYSLSVINTSYIDIESIEIKVGDEVVLSKDAASTDANNVEINHSGQEPISITITSLGDIINYDWSGSIEPQVDSALQTYDWTSLPESGTLSISIATG